jgi:3-dehydroquinate synthase
MTAAVHVHRGDTAGTGYDILIGGGLMRDAGTLLARVLPEKPSALIVTDQNVGDLYLKRCVNAMEAAGWRLLPPVVLPAGEATKTFAHLEAVVDHALEHGVTRDTVVVALGGGVVGDIAGFAASVLLRGIRCVQMPTTLLAMVDSAVGGKTGINTRHGKNLAGSFHHPSLVIADTDMLATLPARELRAGYAEVLKYALIGDPVFFGWLEEHGAVLLAGDAALQAEAVRVCCAAKADIVARDETERADIRALLNLGHTFGHALEALAGYDGRILHGEAVAIGIEWAADLSAHLGLMPAAEAARISRHLLSAGLSGQPPFAVEAAEIVLKMQADKKAKDGRMTLVLLRGIGRAFVSRDVPPDTVRGFLQDRLGGQTGGLRHA